LRAGLDLAGVRAEDAAGISSEARVMSTFDDVMAKIEAPRRVLAEKTACDNTFTAAGSGG